MRLLVDVSIIGAGPAGSTAAALLASRGLKVALLEKDPFPRHKVGESLLPSTSHGIAEMLGLRSRLENAGYVRKNGAIFKWNSQEDPLRIDFLNLPFLRRHDADYAYQVPRHEFDALLLQQAVEKGVQLLPNTRAIDLITGDDHRISGVRAVSPTFPNGFELHSRFVLDATGGIGSFARHLGRKVFSTFFRGVAVYGYWQNAGRLSEPNAGNTIVEFLDDSWIWFIPLNHDSGLTSVGLISPASRGITKARSGDRLTHAVASSDLIFELLQGAVPADGQPFDRIRVAHDWSYLHSCLTAPGFFRLGDAAGFVDPMISSGIHLATYSSLLAADAVCSTLKGALDEREASRLYGELYTREYLTYYRLIRAFYIYGRIKNQAPREPPPNRSRLESRHFARLLSGAGVPGLFPSQSLDVVAKVGDAFTRLDGCQSARTPNLLDLWLTPEGEPMLRFSELVFSDLRSRRHQARDFA